MSATIKIAPEIREILQNATIDSTSVKLVGQLDRATYVAVNKVLVAAGGKWNRKEGAHLFDRDPREALGLAIEVGTIVDSKKELQKFYTPYPVACRLVNLAQLRIGSELNIDEVLEPSAGIGSLCSEINIQAPRSLITAIDIDPVAIECLRKMRYLETILQADFLTITPTPRFDRVVMNPPFCKGQDIAHVTHALKFLKPDGILVAITSPSWQTSTTQAAKAFRDLFNEHDGYVEDIEAGAFKESGTNIRTVALVLHN